VPPAEPEEEPVAVASPRRDPPKGPRPVILQHGSVDAPLFTDELTRLTKDVAKLIEKNDTYPLFVLEPARLAELKAIAATGKLRKDGPKCAAPPSEAEVVNAAYPGLLVANVSFSCTGNDCNASYAVSAEAHRVHTFAPANPFLEGFAKPRDPTSEPDWRAAFEIREAALRKAADRMAGVGFGGIGRGMVGSNGKMSVQWVDTFNVVEARPEDFEREAKAAAASCTKPALFGRILLAVGANGKVSRCESAAGDCYCTAFSKHDFGSGPLGGRVIVHFAHAGLGQGTGLGGKGSGDGGLVRVSQTGRTYDEPFGASKPRTAALAKCFAVGRAAVTIDVRSTLNADGTVIESKVEKGADALTADEKDCVTRASKKFLYRCPDEVGDEVWGRFHIGG
jgi:hypothetical protein